MIAGQLEVSQATLPLTVPVTARDGARANDSLALALRRVSRRTRPDSEPGPGRPGPRRHWQDSEAREPECFNLL